MNKVLVWRQLRAASKPALIRHAFSALQRVVTQLVTQFDAKNDGETGCGWVV